MCPNIFEVAMDSSKKIVQESNVEISFLNIGGGFPTVYPGLQFFTSKGLF